MTAFLTVAKEHRAIKKVFHPNDIIRWFGPAAVYLFIFIAGASGPIGSARAADGGNAVLAAGDARAGVYRRVELTQSGSVKSDDFDSHLRLNVYDCDPDARRIEPACVLLIYEVE